jgi:hypothetical protein
MLRSLRLALPFVVLCLVAAISARPAHAVGNGQFNVVGNSLNDVQLTLTDAQGNQVQQDDRSTDRGAGYWWFRDVRPGTYTVTVRRNGQTVGQPQQVDIRDDATTSFRVDSSTGAVTTVSSMASRTLDHFSVGMYGGFKGSPYNARVSSTALNSTGSGGLDGGWGLMGFEGRYYFNPAQQLAQAFGARLFVYGSYVHYFGSPRENLFLDLHPTPGKDVGASVDEKGSGILGIGGNLNIAQRLGLGLMLGLHVTRLDVSARANETGGGGQNNTFTESHTVVGPAFGAELFYPVAYLQGVGTLEWMLRGQGLWMPDSSVDGRSNLGFDYHARAEGGVDWSGSTGFRVRF